MDARQGVVAMPDQGETHRYGLLQSAIEELLERTRAVANLVGSVGGGALDAMPEPVPTTVNRLLKSLQQLIEQVPPFTAEFDVLLEEIRAQRLTVAALQAELSAFEHQLEILEKSLGGWCSTGVYGGGRDPLGGRERFNGWLPLSILLLAVGFEGCRELLVAVGGCLGPCRRPLGFPRWINSG